MLVHKFSLGHPPNLVNLQTWPSGFPSSFSSFHAVTFPTWCLSTWKENKSSLLCLQEGVALCLLLSTFLKRLIKITFPLRLLFRFRRGFKQFFRCCPFVHVGPEVLTRREVLTSRYSCSGSPDHHRIVRNGKSTSAKVSISKSEALMSKVSHFLPFFPQIRSVRSFILARARRKVIVNHMVSIIAWIISKHTHFPRPFNRVEMLFIVATESFHWPTFSSLGQRSQAFWSQASSIENSLS